MTASPPPSASPSTLRNLFAKRRILVPLLLLAYLGLRLPGLFERPVFTDESVYARWAQLIAAQPLQNLWVSLADAKFPLHYWLLALCRPLAGDPIAAGRWLSVLIGAATIPALLWLMDELGEVVPEFRPLARAAGAIACALVITSPLYALLQRLILAEPLLLLESVLIAGLSLRLARRAAEGVANWRVAILLGVLWGLSLLTKQIFSYLFWSLPLLAWLAHPRGGKARTRIGPLLLATAIGLTIFLPVLLAPSPYGLKSLLLYKPSFHSVTGDSRISIIAGNVGQLLLPRSGGEFQPWPYDAAHPLDNAYLYLYLTPPILLLMLIAIGWMARRRHWRLLAFLGGWAVALLGPLVLGSNSRQLFSRFLLPGMLPLLLILAWAGAAWLDALRRRDGGRLAWSVPVLLILPLLWPTLVVAITNANWKAPTLPAADADQYISGYSGGASTQIAIAWLKERAAQQPITLITGSWFLAPDDLLWLELSDNPNIRLYWYKYDNSVPSPLPGRPNTFLLGESLRASNEVHPVTLDAARPVIFIAPAMRLPGSPTVSSFIPLQDLPAGTMPVASFPNPSWNASLPAMELLVFRIPLSPETVPAPATTSPSGETSPAR